MAKIGLNLRLSRLYRTPAFPPGAGPDFVNAAGVFRAEPDWGAEAILQALHEVETRFDRQRQSRWAPRTLDLDLLALGDLVRPDAATQAAWRNLPASRQARDVPQELILPHPRLQDRAFVLVPLCDVAPDWRHPALGLTPAQMLAALDPADVAAVNPI